MDSDKHNTRLTGRREFLSRLSVAVTGSALVLNNICQGQNKLSEETSSTRPLLPTIRLGDHRITRLIAGWNPIGGYSYMGPVLNRHMQEYFTAERTVEFLWKCEQEGINAHQFSHPEQMAGILRTLLERGSKMKFICLHSGGPQDTSIEQVVQDTRPIAIVHHGGVTDRLFREGKSREVHDFVKRVHDAGVLAGVSAHNPDCIKKIADEGWQVDLFMACFYYITRTAEELEKMPPVVTVQVGNPFFASDPLDMTKVPTDGVIVGMYPRYHDQISQNAQYTRNFAALPET